MEIHPCGTHGASSLGLHEFTSTQMFWISLLRVSLNFLALALVIKPIGTWIKSTFHLLVVSSSFPSSWKGFVLKSSPISKRLKLVTLKVALTFYSPSKSNLYVLPLMRLRTWKSPSPLEGNLDRLCAKNLSFRMCNQTQSSGSKISCQRPLLACFV